jgi:predicted Rossmann fold flavoprotein
MKKKTVAILGGGASGFFCAANLDSSKYDILILEQQGEVLQKVKISGGGRCNVSHACFDARELVKFYPRGSKELLSVFSKFQPGDTMQWFEDRGVPLKIEADNRMFPESNSSQSIINALLNEVNAKQGLIHTKTTIKEIKKQGDAYTIITNNGDFDADIVVFSTGSSGKSWKILQDLGHTLVKAVPSLFTFNCKDPLLTDLPGTSFEWANITIKELKTEEQGPLLITHWGLSGPAILKISAWKARELSEMDYQFDIVINFINQSIAEAEELFSDYKIQHPKKQLGQSKIFSITQRFWQKIIEVSNINPEKQIAQLNKREIQLLVENLCKKKLKIIGKSTFKHEFVTAGGVELKEINFKTMSSKLLDHFYLSGEVLNIDAVTGGFNFQACWSEAWIIAQDLNQKE